MGFRLTWQDNSTAEHGQYVFKSLTPMDPMALPAPIADLAGDVEMYDDGDVVGGTTYYYRVAAYRDGGAIIAVSDELEVEAVPPVSAARWRIFITANGGHTNTSIPEIVFRDANSDPLDYAGGTATASSEFSGSFVAANAFDDNTSSRWASNNLSEFPQWVEFEFASPVAVISADIVGTAAPTGDNPEDFAFEYFDGLDWVQTSSYIGEVGWTSLEVRNFGVQ